MWYSRRRHGELLVLQWTNCIPRRPTLYLCVHCTVGAVYCKFVVSFVSYKQSLVPDWGWPGCTLSTCLLAITAVQLNAVYCWWLLLLKNDSSQALYFMFAAYQILGWLISWSIMAVAIWTFTAVYSRFSGTATNLAKNESSSKMPTYVYPEELRHVMRERFPDPSAGKHDEDLPSITKTLSWCK